MTKRHKNYRVQRIKYPYAHVHYRHKKPIRRKIRHRLRFLWNNIALWTHQRTTAITPAMGSPWLYVCKHKLKSNKSRHHTLKKVNRRGNATPQLNLDDILPVKISPKTGKPIKRRSLLQRNKILYKKFCESGDQEIELTLSHLCHQEACLNRLHHVYETLVANQGRSDCPADKRCYHNPRCRVAGPSCGK